MKQRFKDRVSFIKHEFVVLADLLSKSQFFKRNRLRYQNGHLRSHPIDEIGLMFGHADDDAIVPCSVLDKPSRLAALPAAKNLFHRLSNLSF